MTLRSSPEDSAQLLMAADVLFGPSVFIDDTRARVDRDLIRLPF